MISILNGDKTMANVILVTTSTVVTTETSSSAVWDGRPKPETKLYLETIKSKSRERNMNITARRIDSLAIDRGRAIHC